MSSQRYYYYAWTGAGRYVGNNIAILPGEFDLVKLSRELAVQNRETCVITFWKEISESQYRGFAHYCDSVCAGKLVPSPVSLVPMPEA